MKITKAKLKEIIKQELNESGILYKAGVKKYGKEGMDKILSAAGKKKSHAEIGKIKDKYEKGKKESVNEGPAYEYAKYFRNIEKAQKLMDRSITDLQKVLKKDGHTYQLQQLQQFYTYFLIHEDHLIIWRI